MSKKVTAVLPEQETLEKANLALLSAAAELTAQMDADLTAVLLGSGVTATAAELAAYGADKVIVCDGEDFANFQNELYADTLFGILRDEEPDVVLFGGDLHSQELAATLAARLKTGLTAETLDLRYDPQGEVVLFRTAAVGNVVADIVCPRARPQMATVKTGRIEPIRRTSRTLPAIVRAAEAVRTKARVRVLSREPLPCEDEELARAALVVVAGLGVGSREGLERVRVFARQIGAAVGVTRAVVNAGWAEEKEMIGQTGKILAPEICIELGVSGAVQHVAGVRRAKCLIAVNKNREAPIFSSSDLGVAADLFDFMDAFLLEYLKE